MAIAWLVLSIPVIFALLQYDALNVYVLEKSLVHVWMFLCASFILGRQHDKLSEWMFYMSTLQLNTARHPFAFYMVRLVS